MKIQINCSRSRERENFVTMTQNPEEREKINKFDNNQKHLNKSKHHEQSKIPNDELGKTICS